MDTSFEQNTSEIHPLEHAIRITYTPTSAESPSGSTSPPVKPLLAIATFKRSILLPSPDGSLPEEAYQPQFWLVKLTIPRGLPLHKGRNIEKVKLKPRRRQFGSDGYKSALREISRSSLHFCYYSWLEDTSAVITHHWMPLEDARWVTTTELLRSISSDLWSHFTISRGGHIVQSTDNWSWEGEPAVLLAETPKIIQIYISYTFRCVMVVLASHPGHMVQEMGEDGLKVAADQRMKDLREWVYMNRNTNPEAG
ncbi:hypothetical protein BDW22DRAFT_1475768 [Trametopsis cervina]|nr:hypothetical protein BDW22DRAFT_1475768 [Trametopsis cervina]